MRYSYYKLDGIPCRIMERETALDIAEMYHAGQGFIPGPRMEIEFEGIPISKSEFDTMILATVRKPRPQGVCE